MAQRMSRVVASRVKASRPFWLGVLVGLSPMAILEVSYVNWHPIVAPLEGPSLQIRHDAKGDGRFASPRSGNRRHRGVDLAAPLNSPVRAIRSGTVTQVGLHRGLGRFVELEHRDGLRSLYAHLNSVTVEAGGRVRQGQAIGTVGKTGNARHRWITSHLHLEVLRQGTPVDPATVGLAFVERTPDAEELADARGGE